VLGVGLTGTTPEDDAEQIRYASYGRAESAKAASVYGASGVQLGDLIGANNPDHASLQHSQRAWPAATRGHCWPSERVQEHESQERKSVSSRRKPAAQPHE